MISFYIIEYGIYVRSQANTANGVFNYNTQMSYVVTVTCDDNIETVTDTITVYLTQNSPPVINNLPCKFCFIEIQ
jgi:hypothetical protein